MREILTRRTNFIFFGGGLVVVHEIWTADGQHCSVVTANMVCCYGLKNITLFADRTLMKCS